MSTKKYLKFLINRKLYMVKHRDFLLEDLLITIPRESGSYRVYVWQFLKDTKRHRTYLRFTLQFVLGVVLLLFCIISYLFFYYSIVRLGDDTSFYGSSLSNYDYDWSSIIVYLSAAIVTAYQCLWLYPRIKWMGEFKDTDKKQYRIKIKEIKHRNRAVSKSKQIIGIESYFGYVFGIFFFALKLLGIIATRTIPLAALYVFSDEYIRLTT